jgi:hypothetical protein
MTFLSNDQMPDIAPLIHLYNLHGDNLVGIEVGINRAFSFCALLQLCPNIKELHGVDNWEPYDDYLGSTDGTPVYSVPLVEVEINKAIAEVSVKHCENSNKAVLHHMDSSLCAKQFPDEYFDFIFLDTYLSHDHALSDFNTWYPKIKKGGLFTGHDYYSPEINQAISKFRGDNNITSHLSGFADCYAWVKK